MSLSPGKRLGPYEITAPLGQGGMGEVYRARDTKLERDVALKVLPDALADDEERVARFEREAKLLASLNHPHIASIYGLESNAIVLELVEGPTLAERIQQGPIPVDEALAIAKQIAEALEAGHDAGVIHRDLKPANIKVKDDGTVKVLDYGLAKALEGDATGVADSGLSQSPTLTRQGTEVGVILGTAAYMSPEQAKGKRVDRRTDVWAFGAVVYEMLTGRRAFEGDDVSETLAAVLRAEPDLTALPGDTPGPVGRALALCLTKDVKARLQAMGDVRLAMDGAFETVVVSSSRDRDRRPSVALAVAAVAALLLSAVAGMAVGWATRPDETALPVTRFSLELPPEDSISGGAGWGHILALSPDGTRLVYNANQRLYLRNMDETSAVPIPGSDGAKGSLSLSPDGEWVAFYARGELKKISIDGGSPVALCKSGVPHGTRWGADDAIVFGESGVGIKRVDADGRACHSLIEVREPEGVASGPQILPDGDAVVFTLGSGIGAWDDARIVAQSVDSGERHVLVERGRDARYLASGHLAYVLDGTLLAVPFDARRLEITGGPVPVAEGVASSRPLAAAQFTVSETGTLVYQPVPSPANRLVWVDRDGREELLAAAPGAYRFPRVSPDGTRVAVGVGEFRDMDIWIWDLSRETLSQLTFGEGEESYPVWTPDGRRVAFAAEHERSMQIDWTPADGSGAAEPLRSSERFQFPHAFTRDGSGLVYMALKPGTAGQVEKNIGLLTLGGGSEPILETDYAEESMSLSPDDRWIAYQSDASGMMEIYVQPFPNVSDGRWQISRGGGTAPLWSPDGRELFYWKPGSGLMAVEIDSDTTFAPGNPEPILRGYYSHYGGSGGRDYDISPDGKRFLMIKEPPGADAEAFVVVVNWFRELKRLAPADR